MNPTANARPAGHPPGCAATSNLRIRSLEPLVSPSRLMAQFPLDEAATRTILAGRQAVERVLSGEDPRVIAVVGPCSAGHG